jgi:tryptophan-rich sensory protein
MYFVVSAFTVLTVVVVVVVNILAHKIGQVALSLLCPSFEWAAVL